MPPGFAFPIKGSVSGLDAADFFVPLALTEEELKRRGDGFAFTVMARLAPGVTVERASAEAAAIATRIHAEYPPGARNTFDLRAVVQPLFEQVVGGFAAAADAAVRRRRAAAGDCVRERRQHAAQSRDRPRPRAGGADGARRGPGARHPSVADRERPARLDGRPSRRGDRAGRHHAARARAAGDAAAYRRDRRRREGADVRDRAVGDHRPAVRARAGAERVARRACRRRCAMPGRGWAAARAGTACVRASW